MVLKNLTDIEVRQIIFNVFTGIFMIAEIGLNALATVIAIGIMYVHSNAAFGHAVPVWLLKVVCMRERNKRNVTMYSEYEPTQETDNANVQVPVKRI
jgi:hypothetical protein